MDTYQLLYSTEQQIVGIDSWYYNGLHNNPALIFATGKHGKKDIAPNPFIIYDLKKEITYLYDTNNTIISIYSSSISIDKNLILFGGNIVEHNIETSKLYFISPKTKKCKLIYDFINEKLIYNFSARKCLIKKKKIFIGGTNSMIMLYNFSSKNKLLDSRIINVNSIYNDSVVIGLYYNENILTVGMRMKSEYIDDTGKIIKPKKGMVCSEGSFEKSIYINLLNNDMKYFTTNMQCTSIYHSKECIICIGSGQKKHYSQCFYIPIIKSRFGKKINLAICDGRELLVFNNNLFILCVSDKHIYIENFLSNDRIYHYIDNINPPCRGCILYNNKIIISSIKGTIYILNICNF
jgi:hypothetical protein